MKVVLDEKTAKKIEEHLSLYLDGLNEAKKDLKRAYDLNRKSKCSKLKVREEEDRVFACSAGIDAFLESLSLIGVRGVKQISANVLPRFAFSLAEALEEALKKDETNIIPESGIVRHAAVRIPYGFDGTEAEESHTEARRHGEDGRAE